MPDIAHIEDMIANSEPLESFELDDYTDQEEINCPRSRRCSTASFIRTRHFSQHHRRQTCRTPIASKEFVARNAGTRTRSKLKRRFSFWWKTRASRTIVRNSEWDEDHYCECDNCRYAGTIKDFSEPAAEQDKLAAINVVLLGALIDRNGDRPPGSGWHVLRMRTRIFWRRPSGRWYVPVRRLSAHDSPRRHCQSAR
jgi:hypothetical protein